MRTKIETGMGGLGLPTHVGLLEELLGIDSLHNAPLCHGPFIRRLTKGSGKLPGKSQYGGKGDNLAVESINWKFRTRKSKRQ